jgi:BirA family biotin operon repressor/biotin-[acetyl-CoA-carboxylase] ligase
MASSGGRIAHLVVGIGVNVNVRTFPDELAPTAASLASVAGAVVDRALLAARLCEELERWHDVLVGDGPDRVLAAWKAHSAQLGRPVSAGGVTGIAEDLDEDGALIVRTADGRAERVRSAT